MKVVVAVDSFKGSMSSLCAGTAVAEGIHRVDETVDVEVLPLADGGEGTVEALVSGMHGAMQQVMVTGPLGAPVAAAYGLIARTRTAVIEVSAAAGLTLIPAQARNPLYTTSYGVGELIRDAVEKGCRRFVIGLGGSATNDGGAGMLQALGYGLLNGEGNQIPYGAAGLAELRRITADHVLPQLAECSFRVACDVTNPLCGERGASAVYGPQKGATPAMVLQMDRWLQQYAALTAQTLPGPDPMRPGMGAAGGLGFAFAAFTRATLESGIDIVLEETGLEQHARQADLVITGEGRLDEQTAMGKAPVGVARLAKKYGKPVVAFAGSVTREARACNEAGIDAFFPILRGVVTLEEAMEQETARRNMADTAEQVFRLLRMAGR